MGLLPASLACSILQGGGPARNPEFAAGQAPEPTVVTGVVSCVPRSLPPGSGETATARFDAVLRGQIQAEPVPVSPSMREIICTTLATAQKFHSHSDWSPSPSLAGTLRAFAKQTGAKSVAVPVMRVYGRCEKNTATVRNSAGASVGSVDLGTETCSEDKAKDLGLFLVRDDGTVLYKSTRAVGMLRDDLEEGMVGVLQAVPASFGAPAAAPETPDKARDTAAAEKPSPEAAPPEPRDTKEVDSLLAGVDANTPAECKAFLEAACRNPALPEGARSRACTGYVTTVRQLVERSRSQAGAACSGLRQSAAAR
jgi:hypothetical protein